MERRTANNFMAVYERFGDSKFPIVGNFKPTILYALSAPSTPDSVVEKAIEKAEADGVRITAPLWISNHPTRNKKPRPAHG